MPQGVQHHSFQSSGRCVLKVARAVMPQGVQHAGEPDTLSAVWTSGPRSDAARRSAPNSVSCTRMDPQVARAVMPQGVQHNTWPPNA